MKTIFISHLDGKYIHPAFRNFINKFKVQMYLSRVTGRLEYCLEINDISVINNNFTITMKQTLQDRTNHFVFKYLNENGWFDLIETECFSEKEGKPIKIEEINLDEQQTSKEDILKLIGENLKHIDTSCFAADDRKFYMGAVLKEIIMAEYEAYSNIKHNGLKTIVQTLGQVYHNHKELESNRSKCLDFRLKLDERLKVTFTLEDVLEPHNVKTFMVQKSLLGKLKPSLHEMTDEENVTEPLNHLLEVTLEDRLKDYYPDLSLEYCRSIVSMFEQIVSVVEHADLTDIYPTTEIIRKINILNLEDTIVR